MGSGSNRPGMCGQCRAAADHRRPKCPLCGFELAHVTGVSTHLATQHKFPGGSRNLMLLVDVARAQVRDWPVGPAVEACRKAKLPVLHEDIFR